jgi:polyisoprenoid-binding protein YceI
MAMKDALRRHWKWLLVIVPVAVVAVVVGGTFIYIHFIAPDPAPRLTFSSPASSAPSSGASSGTSSGGPFTLDGAWTVTSGSEAGYRVQEVLSGQDNEATGRTTKVTGDMTAAGTAISAANVTVDMASVASGEGLRDSQFKGRIMQTSQFPTSSFALKAPIDLGSVPADQAEITVKATGTLTLHGVAKDVTIDLSAKRNGATIEVLGTVPITFSDYDISNPSGGPATVGDNGEMEFHVIFTK